MAKLKLPLPLSGGINTQADPSQEAAKQLRNARNAYYLRDDMTLRRRPDLAGVLNPAESSFSYSTTALVHFENTRRTFKKLVVKADYTLSGTTFTSYLSTNVESPATLTSINPVVTVSGSPSTQNTTNSSGYVHTVQYNDILYIPGGSSNRAIAWNGTGVGRGAGIDIQDSLGANSTFSINTAGAGSLTMVTGRKYTWTLFDSVNGIESMPSNNGSVLNTVTTGVITNKGPVVTVTWNGITSPQVYTTGTVDSLRLYATEDGGATYYLHSTNTISSPSSDTATISITDSTSDAVLATGAVLEYNSPPPTARFMAKFENKLVAGGAQTNTGYGVGVEPVQSNVLYYALPDEPEHWRRNLTFNTGVCAIPFRDQEGDELLGAIQVNRVLLVGLRGSVWSINHLPIPGVDPLFDLNTLKDRIVATHGFVSINCYCNIQLTDDEDATFYVSQRGFHINNGSSDMLISDDLRWDKTVYNDAQLDKLFVINDTQNYYVIVAFASVSSSVVDTAYVYHYHPSQRNEAGLGKVTGPWDYAMGAAALVRRTAGNYEVWSAPSASGSIILAKLSGSTGVDYTGASVPFEWETGWLRVSDDASARLRELNFTVQEADSASLALGSSSLSQVVPKVRFLQLNSSGPVVKVLWDDDSVTVKQITGSGRELSQSAGTVSITNTDRAIVSATLDCEVYGEEKTLARSA